MAERDQPRPGMRNVERDPSLPGASTRPTTGAAPAVERQHRAGQQSSDGQDSGQMKEKASQAADQAREKAGQMTEGASQAADQAREKVSEMTSTATSAIDERRGQASDAMESAAQQLRERGESLPGGERTTEMASMAADKVEATSSYVREHDVEDMMSDLEVLVRNHPTQSLIAAAAAGFLVGRMLRG